MGCHFLLQGIFPIQELNSHLLLGSLFFTTEPPGKTQDSMNKLVGPLDTHTHTHTHSKRERNHKLQNCQQSIPSVLKITKSRQQIENYILGVLGKNSTLLPTCLRFLPIDILSPVGKNSLIKNLRIAGQGNDKEMRP